MTRCHKLALVSDLFICISCKVLFTHVLSTDNPLFRFLLKVSINTIQWVTLVPSLSRPLCLCVHLHANVFTEDVWVFFLYLFLCLCCFLTTISDKTFTAFCDVIFLKSINIDLTCVTDRKLAKERNLSQCHRLAAGPTLHMVRRQSYPVGMKARLSICLTSMFSTSLYK